MKKYAPRKKWSDAETQAVIRRYPHESTESLAADLGVSKFQLYEKASYLGIKKSEQFMEEAKSRYAEFLTEVGKYHRFQKGIIPWNKGKEWNAQGRSSLTRFKERNRPQSWKPIGSEVVSRDGYMFRKVSDTGIKREDWFPVSHLAWKEAGNGGVPNGYHLCFRDGNKLNFDIGNLELVSNQEIMRRNGIHKYGPEISSLYQLIGAINRQINKRKKEQK